MSVKEKTDLQLDGMSYLSGASDDDSPKSSATTPEQDSAVTLVSNTSQTLAPKTGDDDRPFTDANSPSSEGMSTTRTQVKPLANRNFGRYELLLKMGAGGMATIYLGRTCGLQGFEKRVVIKKIHDHLADEKQFVDMFMDEARISAMIHHPNVVQIFDLGSIDEALFIAMEYVEGVDLAQLLNAAFRMDRSTFGWDFAVRIVADSAAGLHAAHELTDTSGKNIGLVHRDVSPQNILVSYGGHVKIVDFGIAYAAEKISQTQTGTLKGKLAYMSPEQSRGETLDRRSDVFALGIVLFEAVCRRRLFRSKTEAETLLRVSAADVPRPSLIRPEIPEDLEEIILKALQGDRNLRYQTAQELQRALEELLASKAMVVGSTQIGELMTRLFHDQKLIREQHLREQSELSTVGQALQFDAQDSIQEAASATANNVVSTQESEVPQHPRRLATALPLVIGVIGILAVIIATVVVVMHLGTSAPRPAKSAEEPRSQPPAPQPDTGMPALRPSADSVVLTFFITPGGAALFLNNKEHLADKATLKRVVHLKRNETPIKIKVTAIGYMSKIGNVVPVQDQMVTVNLLKEGGVSSDPKAGGRIKVIRTPRRRRRRRSSGSMSLTYGESTASPFHHALSAHPTPPHGYADDAHRWRRCRGLLGSGPGRPLHPVEYRPSRGQSRLRKNPPDSNQSALSKST